MRDSDMLVASAFINPLTKACHVAALTKPPRHLTHALTKLQTNGSHVAALTKPPRRLTYALTKPQIGTGRAPTCFFFVQSPRNPHAFQERYNTCALIVLIYI